MKPADININLIGSDFERLEKIELEDWTSE